MSERVRENYNKPSAQNTRSADTRPAFRPNQNSKSPFEKLLDKTTNTADAPKSTGLLGPSATETQQAVQAMGSQAEPYSGQNKFKESFDKKLKESEKDTDESKGGSSSEGTSKSREADHRVVSRDSHGGGRDGRRDDGHSGGGSQGQGQSSGHQQKGKGSQQGSRDSDLSTGLSQKSAKTAKPQAKFDMGALTDRSEMPLSPQLSQLLEKKIATDPHMKAVLANMKEVPKAVLDQIVMYSRLVTRTDGDKEWVLQMKEEVFQGLKLKVVSKKGRVEATLIAPNEEVAKFLKSHQEDLDKLKESMKEKGIDVASIHVTINHSSPYERHGIPV